MNEDMISGIDDHRIEIERDKAIKAAPPVSGEEIERIKAQQELNRKAAANG